MSEVETPLKKYHLRSRYEQHEWNSSGFCEWCGGYAESFDADSFRCDHSTLGTDPEPEELAWRLKEVIPQVVTCRVRSTDSLIVGRRGNHGDEVGEEYTFGDIEQVIEKTIWNQNGHECHNPAGGVFSEVVRETTTFTVLVR